MLPSGAALATFLLASLALNFVPGPDMLFIIARAVGQGRRAGAVAALGIGAGIIVHILAATLGLAALLELAPLAYLAIKYAGAAYLLWIGIRLLTDRSAAAPAARLAPVPLWTIFRQGAVTNILNPKIALFFLAFLPQFVDHGAAASPAAQMLALGGLFDVGGTAINLAIGCGFGLAGDWLRRRPAIWKAQRWLTGGIFIGLALRLAVPERR
ncbi:MAG: LysE family translocator [Alphaproteobacteria bacterium]|nr:LysE family translocator [Alphaproteobacteria bacterium]